MKRALALLGLIVVGVMLLVKPDTGVVAVAEQVFTSTTSAPTTTTAPPDPTDASSDGTAAADSTTTTTTTASAASFVGDPVRTRFGSFQVEVAVENGVLVDVATLDQPADRHSRSINAFAIPLYEEAALETQSADFNALSGATVTWRAWTASLATALEAAGVG